MSNGRVVDGRLLTLIGDAALRIIIDAYRTVGIEPTTFIDEPDANQTRRVTCRVDHWQTAAKALAHDLLARQVTQFVELSVMPYVLVQRVTCERPPISIRVHYEQDLLHIDAAGKSATTEEVNVEMVF
jgi:hypothetical protein